MEKRHPCSLTQNVRGVSIFWMLDCQRIDLIEKWPKDVADEVQLRPTGNVTKFNLGTSLHGLRPPTPDVNGLVGPDNLLSGWPKATGSGRLPVIVAFPANASVRFLCASRTRTTSCPGQRISPPLGFGYLRSRMGRAYLISITRSPFSIWIALACWSRGPQEGSVCIFWAKT